MEIAPLLAECAFRLGESRFSRGDWTNAQDYLSRSLSITASLADDLTATNRKAYLSHPSNREARRLSNEASTKSAAMPSRLPESGNAEGTFFGKLYRLNASMTAAIDVESALSVLLQTLKETISHSIIIVSGTGSKLSYQPVRAIITDEIRRRVATIASCASDKPYLAGKGTTRNQGTIVWVPIASLALPSGIYVESLPGTVLLNERDIEFLALIAAISGAGF